METFSLENCLKQSCFQQKQLLVCSRKWDSNILAIRLHVFCKTDLTCFASLNRIKHSRDSKKILVHVSHWVRSTTLINQFRVFIITWVEFDANNFFSSSDVESFSVSFDIRKHPDETAYFIQNSWERVPNDLQKIMDWGMLDDVVVLSSSVNAVFGFRI